MSYERISDQQELMLLLLAQKENWKESRLWGGKPHRKGPDLWKRNEGALRIYS